MKDQGVNCVLQLLIVGVLANIYDIKGFIYIFHEILWNWRMFTTTCWCFQERKPKQLASCNIYCWFQSKDFFGYSS